MDVDGPRHLRTEVTGRTYDDGLPPSRNGVPKKRVCCNRVGEQFLLLSPHAGRPFEDVNAADGRARSFVQKYVSDRDQIPFDSDGATKRAEVERRWLTHRQLLLLLPY